MHRWAAAALLTVVLGACGTSPNVTSARPERSLPPGSVDPCALVAKSEAEATFGGRVINPARQDKGQAFACIYRGVSGGYLQLTVDASANAAKSFAAAAGSAGNTAISGVGDAGYRYQVPQGNEVLLGVVALKDKTAVGVAMTTSNAKTVDVTKALVALLKKAIAKV